MPNLQQVSNYLRNRFESQITAYKQLERRDGRFASFPDDLHTDLRDVLVDQGIDRLYSHQAEAYEAVKNAEDTLLVAQTASGKTLSFLLPVLDEYLKADAPFSVMLMYPTKALSRDQENTLGGLLKPALGNLKLGTFDGDTPREQRRQIQRMTDFVITNPDMLHSGILPNHNRGWSNFLSRLKYIIVDEVHTYRGDFGSHVANVFRRLLRACEIHGSRPLFICSSATVGNPSEHVEALCHRSFRVLDSDGAPRPQRSLYFVNPPLVEGQGAVAYRKGPGSISVPLIRKAARAGVRTICFCRARQEVERLVKAVTDNNPDLAGCVKPYRGGLLPNERRRLERDLFDGRINTVITTNALELGIDIGDLDLCILSGHPGTVASFWQQAGRVGRKSNEAMIVFAAKNAPIDQYLVHHPEFITSAPIEQAWLDADNPYIVLQHLPCTAYEHPLSPDEGWFGGQTCQTAVQVLKQDNTLAPYGQCYRYALSDYPARGVSLRGMTDYNVVIYCGEEVIGEIDPVGARGTLYKDAIYQHLGRRYMSRELDLERKLCRVQEVHVDYYTEAVWESRIEMTEEEESKSVNEAEFKFGFVHVNKQPKMYKKIRERTFENIGYGPITLPAFEYDTMGFSMLTPPAWKAVVDEEDKRYLGAALFGLSYLIRRTAPSLCMADVKDIDTDVSLHQQEEVRWKSALYLYDTHEGGVGYSEKIYEKIEQALELCRNVLTECVCDAGCPSCVPPLPPGVDAEDMEDLLIESDAAKACTLSLLNALIDGHVEKPEVRTWQTEADAGVEAPGEDEEQKKLNKRLNKASRILRDKRERTH